MSDELSSARATLADAFQKAGAKHPGHLTACIDRFVAAWVEQTRIVDTVADDTFKSEVIRGADALRADLRRTMGLAYEADDESILAVAGRWAIERLEADRDGKRIDDLLGELHRAVGVAHNDDLLKTIKQWATEIVKKPAADELRLSLHSVLGFASNVPVTDATLLASVKALWSTARPDPRTAKLCATLREVLSIASDEDIVPTVERRLDEIRSLVHGRDRLDGELARRLGVSLNASDTVTALTSTLDTMSRDAEARRSEPFFQAFARLVAEVKELRALRRESLSAGGVTKPIPMLLHCPRCDVQHIDLGEWSTRPHRTHLCDKLAGGCGYEWRPAMVYTVGVAALPEESK